MEKLVCNKNNMHLKCATITRFKGKAVDNKSQQINRNCMRNE